MKARAMWKSRLKSAGAIRLTLFLFFFLVLPLRAQPGGASFEGAAWIWVPGAGSPPAEARGFRGELEIPESPALESAEVLITCDNLFVLYLDGRPVGEGGADNNAWKSPLRFDLTTHLAPGRHILAVEAVNTLPGAAGLIVKLSAEMSDQSRIELASGATWKCGPVETANWQQPNFDDKGWPNARVVGAWGVRPWGEIPVPGKAIPAGRPIGKVHAATAKALANAARQATARPIVEQPAPPDFTWPDAIAFLAGDCSLYRPHGKSNVAADSLSVTIFNPRNSRAFPEHDLPAPMKIGRRLCVLRPARPGAEPRVLLDAGKGAIGSPGVTFDGQSLLFSMAREGDRFFHIFRAPAAGGEPVQLTEGPFHDIDPAEMPDGRIVFTSTRIGTFEEYHSPPSRSLFTMKPDGGDIRPLTHTIIFDNEPEVLADGRLVCIRSDNFFDRGKVETRLHSMNPDGSRGYTEFGMDNGPEYGGRLRAFLCGSPAPMPDGRLAFVSGPGITIGRTGSPEDLQQHLAIEAGDVAALPDGRLLCTTARHHPVEIVRGAEKQVIQEIRYEKIGVIDPDSEAPGLTILHDADGGSIHSPVYLGPRKRPPVLTQRADETGGDDVQATGYLFCQNARLTKNTEAGWPHVRAMRVIAGKGLTVRSSHSYIVHAGNETVELGTVPLAPDGSFYVEVPANTPLALQAVDAEGRSELNEMSWIYVKPGEKRGCVGCHTDRPHAPLPDLTVPLATTIQPLQLLGRGDQHRFRGNNAAVTGLMNLQFDRYREVAGLNRFGWTGDPVATLPREIAALVERLKGANAEERAAAAQRLSIFRDPAAAPALAERLGDPVREVRVAAAMALAACGTRDSVPRLLDALTGDDLLVVQAAAVALENLTGHREENATFAGESERTKLAEKWRAWVSATPWEKIEAGLVEKLSSPDRDIVRRAAVTLGHIGGDRSREALQAYVDRERKTNPFPKWREGNQNRGDRAQFSGVDEVNPRTLQAAVRSLGYLRDTASVPMLAEIIAAHQDPETANLFLVEAAVEALGRIGNAEAEAALIAAFAGLADYHIHTRWYGDHPALMSCHAAPVHFFILEALDRMGSTAAGEILPHIIRSVPIDPDRALFPFNDDYESLAGRILRRHGAEKEVVDTCLAILGDPGADKSPRIEEAIGKVERCWGGHPDARNRAAQILSLTARDPADEPRIRRLFEQVAASETDIPRVFDTGIPIVDRLPDKHWVAFFLARNLGCLGSENSVDSLIQALRDSPPEAAEGRPDPLGPGVLFLHNDLTPCWRAAVAWALGEIGDRRAMRVLLDIIGNLDNALDTRHTAATSLGRLGIRADLPILRKLAQDYPEISVRRELRRVIVDLEG